MNALGLLHFLDLALITIAFTRCGAGLRVGLGLGLVTWAALSVFIAEMCSLMGLLTQGAALSFWLLVGVAAVMAVRSVVPKLSTQRGVLSALDRSILAALCFIGAATLYLAVVHEPSTSDALTYRLPRIEQWIANGTLDHFPTHNARQVDLPILPELLLLQARLLGGDFTWAALVQWVSLMCASSAVMLIVEHLGGDRRMQLLGALVAATVPMAVLQASSTQSDLTTAAFLLVTVERLLAFVASDNTRRALWAALAGGLALLAKGTSYLLGFPFAVLFAVVALKRLRLRAMPLLAGCLVIALLPNTGFFLRNLGGFGNPLGGHGEVVNNASFGPTQTADNLIRNVAMNLMIGVPGWDVALVRIAERVRAATGIDAHEADTTFAGSTLAVPSLPGWTRHEDFAPAPLHTVIFMLAIVAVLAKARDPGRRAPLVYLVCLSAGALLFCSILRWQPWGTRLQLPLLMLSAPLVVIAFERLRSSTILGFIVALVLVTQAAPVLVGNTIKPMVAWPFDPAEPNASAGTMLVNRPGLAVSLDMLGTLQAVKEATAIGLYIYEDEFELPLRLRLPPSARVEHVGVVNDTAAFPWPRGDFAPEIVIASRDMGVPPQMDSNMPWLAGLETPVFRVFLPSKPLQGRAGSLFFGAEAHNGVLAEGWSTPESGGVWSVGPAAALYLHLSDAFTGALRLRIQGVGYLGGSMVERVLRVTVGSRASYWHIPADAPRQVFEVAIPFEERMPGNTVRVEFSFEDHPSPRDFGQDDARELGVFLERLDWELY